MTIRRNIFVYACAAIAAYGCQSARADDFGGVPQQRHATVDWKQLNLSQQQDERVQSLENDWRIKYSQTMPQIKQQQTHLQDLFKNPQSDPLEIVSTQQSIARLHEQLRNEAMANYLRKRSVLNDSQQKMLEAQLQQMVVDRQQRPLVQRAGSEEQNGIMNLIQKVRWAIEPH